MQTIIDSTNIFDIVPSPARILNGYTRHPTEVVGHVGSGWLENGRSVGCPNKREAWVEKQIIAGVNVANFVRPSLAHASRLFSPMDIIQQKSTDWLRLIRSVHA